MTAKTEHYSKTDLFKLLDLNYYSETDRQKLDTRAIILEVQQNPQHSNVLYQFSHGNKVKCLPLHQAIKLRAPAPVINALCSPYALEMKYCGSNTALHLAMEYNASLDLVLLLLNKQPNAAKEKTMEGFTALHRACVYQASKDIICLLLKYWPDATKQIISGGYTPLHVACEYEADVQVIDALVQSYPDAVRMQTEEGYTPLHFACKWNASAQVVSLLLEHYPQATQIKTTGGGGGYTPLHLACRHNASLEVVELLLESHPRACMEKTNYGGSGYYVTPLHMACRFRAKLDIILVVLEFWIRMKQEEQQQQQGMIQYDDNDNDNDDDNEKEEEEDSDGEIESLKFGASEEIKKLLSHVSILLSSQENQQLYQPQVYFSIGYKTSKNPSRVHLITTPTTTTISQKISRAINFFNDIEWYKGIVFMIEKYPAFVPTSINFVGNNYHYDGDDNDEQNDNTVQLKAHFLSMVGHCCNLTTIWEVICNEQDLLAHVF